ncbi:MAG TPA: tRNA (guanosine(46)-N7)-methyltransferase TrmB [Caulobacteraceae bacterium]|jgi:tRNA (guanine-N7-)-methyltransferase|nr:tRNA (guanosine(46)-N7)-methyltransferase TrmB [Caulobacteraceae bacterium]
MADDPPALRTYGRIKARPLKPRQGRLMETLLPALSVPDGPFDPRAIMPEAREVWLEAGFGAGEHLATQAARHPDALLLGAEPFVNGIAACLAHLDDSELTNVRLLHGDVRALMARLPDGVLDRIYVNFPDPWPKTRHKKRRLIEPGFIADAARLMRPGAVLRFATDWADYADWTLQRFAAAPAFRWTAERAADWRTPPADHVTTRYEIKQLGDCAPIWLEFVRV